MSNKYVIDVDGTICHHPEYVADYSSAVPYEERIAKINELYDNGNTIVYLTARGMGRFDDDAEMASEVFYELTLEQLNTWGCKFHKLVMGKPSGDYYIDDKAVTDNDFF